MPASCAGPDTRPGPRTGDLTRRADVTAEGETEPSASVGVHRRRVGHRSRGGLENPRRTIPRATLVGTVVTALV